MSAPRSGLPGRLCRRPAEPRLIRRGVAGREVTDSGSTRPHHSPGLPPQPEPLGRSGSSSAPNVIPAEPRLVVDASASPLFEQPVEHHADGRPMPSKSARAVRVCGRRFDVVRLDAVHQAGQRRENMFVRARGAGSGVRMVGVEAASGRTQTGLTLRRGSASAGGRSRCGRARPPGAPLPPSPAGTP